MEAMDGVNREIARVFAAKEDRRRRLARLPFPEKVRALLKLQEMAVTILSTRGKSVKPWRIATDGAEDSPKNQRSEDEEQG
jgi:hypothetical protein